MSRNHLCHGQATGYSKWLVVIRTISRTQASWDCQASWIVKPLSGKEKQINHCAYEQIETSNNLKLCKHERAQLEKKHNFTTRNRIYLLVSWDDRKCCNYISEGATLVLGCCNIRIAIQEYWDVLKTI